MRTTALGMLIGALAVTACASTPHNQPAWVTQRLAETGHTFPNLHDVPRTNDVNTDASHWAVVQSDVTAAAQAMRADPRNQPAPPNDSQTFINDAHSDIDAARQAHGPS